jgi:hypothetical protein
MQLTALGISQLLPPGPFGSFMVGGCTGVESEEMGGLSPQYVIQLVLEYLQKRKH